MPVVQFNDARDMVSRSHEWMTKLSNYISDPKNTPPFDCLGTQKLAFEVSKEDLEFLLQQHRVVGVLGMEEGFESLTVVLVGLNEDNKPVSNIKPRETFPVLNKMEDLQIVLDDYLTP